jgi:hypothetical protein
MIDQVDRIISSLNALHAEADQVIDTYVTYIRERDNLGGIPLDCIRQTAVENRASSFSMNMRLALELIRSDLAGERAPPPANVVPSAASEFHLEGVPANLNLREAARQLKQRRSHE